MGNMNNERGGNTAEKKSKMIMVLMRSLLGRDEVLTW